MNLTLQILLSGLAAGSVYGLLAVGHTLVYRLTGIVHFALGDLVGLGVFVALFVTSGRGPVTAASASSWRFAVGLVVALLVTAALGSGSYFAVIHQYVTRGSTLGWVAATVAIAFAIENTLAVVFQRPAYVFPDPLPFRKAGNDGIVSLGGATFQLRSLFVIALGIVLAAAVTHVIRRTSFGRGLQAIAADSEGARIVGVPVTALVAGAFGLVGGLAALAAIAAAPNGPFDTGTGVLLGLKGLVAALVVRFGSPWRAFGAGIVLGIAEAAVAGLPVDGHELGAQYREVLPFALVLLFTAVRPAREALEEQE